MNAKHLVVLIVLLLFAPLPLCAFEVITIYPDTIAAGESVSVIGGPFDEGYTLSINGETVSFTLSDARHLVFRVPQLAPGVYPLLLTDTRSGAEQTYTLQVVLPPPEITSLSPSEIDECSDASGNSITLHGRNLLPESRLLINGLAVPFEWHNDGELAFTSPTLTAGVYGVEVVNPDGRKSLPQSLAFSNVPEIFSVDRGDDFVNYYQLVIHGKNFFQRSLLVVSEYPSGASDQPPRQRAVIGQGLQTQHQQGARLRQEVVYYQDCQTLIYNRYPLSSDARRLVLWVTNPDGKQTPAFELTAP